MSGFYVKLGLFGLCVAFLVGLVVWLVWRKNRKAARVRAAELSAFASELGGTVTDRQAGARPWSADLTRAMANEHGTFLKWLGRQSEPRFDYALDFARDGWRVRVTEASMEKATSPSTRTAQEVRIEQATADLVPLKIIRRRYSGSSNCSWPSYSCGTSPSREESRTPRWTVRSSRRSFCRPLTRSPRCSTGFLVPSAEQRGEAIRNASKATWTSDDRITSPSCFARFAANLNLVLPL
jgi:hypothetical protein